MLFHSSIQIDHHKHNFPFYMVFFRQAPVTTTYARMVEGFVLPTFNNCRRRANKKAPISPPACPPIISVHSFGLIIRCFRFAVWWLQLEKKLVHFALVSTALFWFTGFDFPVRFRPKCHGSSTEVWLVFFRADSWHGKQNFHFRDLYQCFMFWNWAIELDC